MVSNTDNNTDTFFALVRSGLWERSDKIPANVPIDVDALYQLAEEQSVVGLVAAGLQYVDKELLASQQTSFFMEKVMALEHRNRLMNRFIEVTAQKMSEAGIHFVVLKGQGVAQCYEKPLWRASGDIDLLLDAYNYEKAKSFLAPVSSRVKKEESEGLHQGMVMGAWVVELHGKLHNYLFKKSNLVIDQVQEDTLNCEGVRVWQNGDSEVLLPSADNDVIFIFSHIIQHFFSEGIGLRQICDWCRLLWTFRETIDRTLLESRVRRMGFVTEWKAFAAFAVDDLGMPAGAMPMYDPASLWHRKARRIKDLVLNEGNLGHKRAGYKKYHPLIRKSIAIERRISNFCHRFPLFPMDALHASFYSALVRAKVLARK